MITNLTTQVYPFYTGASSLIFVPTSPFLKSPSPAVFYQPLNIVQEEYFVLRTFEFTINAEWLILG